jgi:hypothetical protein
MAELPSLGELSSEQRAAVLGVYALVQGLACQHPFDQVAYQAASTLAPRLATMISGSWNPGDALVEYIRLEACLHAS